MFIIPHIYVENFRQTNPYREREGSTKKEKDCSVSALPDALLSAAANISYYISSFGLVRSTGPHLLCCY
jgi:hypothetical protein